MSDVPKIVQDRLWAATPREGHPDADVLTAFAEHSLPGAEREDVVRHLARCGDCREVVALSIPPSVEAARQPETAVGETSARRPADRSRGWFAWPNLRWAAMAAGVIVVASVVMLRPGQKPEPTDATVNYPAENKVQTQLADAPANSGAASVTEHSRSSVATAAKPEKSLLRKEPATARDEALPEREQTRTAAAPASLADSKRADSSGDKRSYSFANNRPAMQKPAAPEVSAGYGTVAPEKIGRVTESVEVSGANAEIQTAPAEGNLMARNEAQALPIEKAKQATKEEGRAKSQASESAAQQKLVGAYLQSDSAVTLQKQRLKKSDNLDKDAAPQWGLAEGKLQRSPDAGATWQIVLQLEHPLLAYGARGSDVWAGGQAGTLFHSTDSGATWAMIQPSTKAGTLTADIVGIDVRSAAEVVLSTNRKESWTTFDAGRTWEKR
jgi:hypothetical protein